VVQLSVYPVSSFFLHPEPRLAVYTGTAVNALDLVGTSRTIWADSGQRIFNVVTLPVIPNTTYSVRVSDRLLYVTGEFSINVVLNTPPNDLFSAAVSTFPATGTTLGSTLEVGEPGTVAGKATSGSVWYRFAAASNGGASVRLEVLYVGPPQP
jgi:hypothetical protein